MYFGNSDEPGAHKKYLDILSNKIQKKVNGSVNILFNSLKKGSVEIQNGYSTCMYLAGMEKTWKNF